MPGRRRYKTQKARGQLTAGFVVQGLVSLAVGGEIDFQVGQVHLALLLDGRLDLADLLPVDDSYTSSLAGNLAHGSLELFEAQAMERL